MHSVRECAAKMRSVQPLLDMITNGQIHADVDEFMEQLGQLNESITFAQKHKGLRDVPDVLIALKDARRKALSGLEFEYSRVLEAQKPSEEDEEWETGSEVQALTRLRDALGERGQDETSNLFVKIRSRVVATHLRSLEEALLISIRYSSLSPISTLSSPLLSSPLLSSPLLSSPPSPKSPPQPFSFNPFCTTFPSCALIVYYHYTQRQLIAALLGTFGDTITLNPKPSTLNIAALLGTFGDTSTPKGGIHSCLCPSSCSPFSKGKRVSPQLLFDR